MRRAPDKISNDARSKAWIIPDPTPEILAKNPAAGTVLRAWLVQQPNVHPHWEHWVVNVSHLRDLEGVPPAHKQFASATHEITILSCDPDAGLPDPDKPEGWRFLMPQDLVKQIEATDEFAARLVDLMIDATIAGKMALDSDYRGAWNQIIDRTIDHNENGCTALS